MTGVVALKQIIAARLDVADRIEEAFDVLGRLPDRTKAMLGTQTLSWPLVVRRMFEDAPRDVSVRRPPPTAQQVDAMNEVLTWMVALGQCNRNWAKAVFLICGRRRSVTSASRALGCHRETARVWCNDGLDYVSAWRAQREAA